jgi:hypothetical protein
MTRPLDTGNLGSTHSVCRLILECFWYDFHVFLHILYNPSRSSVGSGSGIYVSTGTGGLDISNLLGIVPKMSLRCRSHLLFAHSP